MQKAAEALLNEFHMKFYGQTLGLKIYFENTDTTNYSEDSITLRLGSM